MSILDVEDSVKFLLSLITKIKEEEKEQRSWEIYKLNYQNMTKENFETYEEWKKPPERKKSKAEILKQVELITMCELT